MGVAMRLLKSVSGNKSVVYYWKELAKVSEMKEIPIEKVYSPGDLALLRAMQSEYSTIASAQAEIAALRAGLSLRKQVAHVISDIHGDYKKLRHVINNASGSLRPLVEELFETRLSAGEIRDFLSVLYYPHEAMHLLGIPDLPDERQLAWALRTLRQQFEIVRKLSSGYRRKRAEDAFPAAFQEFFHDLLDEPYTARGEAYVETMAKSFAESGRLQAMVRAASRVVRNLSVGEIFVAGDMGDRGPRIDKVIEYLMRQPNVAITWGNHDVSWMGACLGQEAAIATVLRISLRYRRLLQIEEGYGISLQPLEKLARNVYGEDPAEHFTTKRSGDRDDLLMARMQKAIAIMLFKLEGQASLRHPEWNLDNRNLLHRMDLEKATVEIEGKSYALLDTYFPTVDFSDPYSLSPDEQECMTRLQSSFVNSKLLWDQMRYLVNHGSMWARRDDVLIFHACVPTDENGAFLPLEVNGVEYRGKALFDSINSLIRRTFRKGADERDEEADWLWYLWTGELSPLFGKDKMATFETYFVADKATQKETKNPYFDQIHDAEFCKGILREFGVSEDGLIVNGHVPVKISEGEQPVKRGGNAVTIDGAFSEVYGDHGYTLILEPNRIALAEHSHFESVEEAITTGADIIPKIRTLREYSPYRHLSDTEDGETMRETIALLERLIHAYEEGLLIG